MKRLNFLIAACLFSVGLFAELPLVATLTTTKAVSNAYHFNLLASVADSKAMIDWGNGNVSNVVLTNLDLGDDITSVGQITPDAALTIKIYGENIIGIACSNKHISSVVFHNPALSLTKIDLGANAIGAFDTSLLTGLKELTIGVDNTNPEIDLRACSNLQKVTITANTSFNNLKLEGLANLTDVNIAGSGFTTIDFTSNTALKNVVMSNNPFVDAKTIITTLPATMNGITALGCNLTSIDLSRFVDLTSVNLSRNPLVSLDLQNNTKLKTLHLQPGSPAVVSAITKLDLSKNLSLATVNINGTAAAPSNIEELILPTEGTHTEVYVDINASYNKLSVFPATVLALRRMTLNNNRLKAATFTNLHADVRLFLAANNLKLSTLPVKPAAITNASYFTYIDQAPIVIAEEIGASNETLDLSSEANAQGVLEAPVATTFTWKKINGDILTPNTDYTETEPGKFVFKPSLNGEKIYCVLSTTAFPLFTGAKELKTTEMTVKIASNLSSNQTDNVKVITLPDGILLSNIKERSEIQIFSVTGKQILATVVSEDTTISLNKGVYIVRVNDTIRVKAIVR